ncbi:MAG: hypothetical protein NTY13_06630 [Chlamydiae bacterium]|nr:hypothetical protein [Chlamydiota bacterium]
MVSWHFSHAKGRCVKGINILSGLIRYGDMALPIGYEVIKKDLYFCDIKTKKEKRQSSTTKNQHLRALVAQAVENGVLFDYVLADNWFGAKDNMEFIHYGLKKFFVFGIKTNRSNKIPVLRSRQRRLCVLKRITFSHQLLLIASLNF